MERISVESTNLASVGYDEDSSTLEIEFLNGGIYQYNGVPTEIHEGLINAGSKGQYFHQNIRNSGYPYSKIS